MSAEKVAVLLIAQYVALQQLKMHQVRYHRTVRVRIHLFPPQGATAVIKCKMVQVATDLKLFAFNIHTAVDTFYVDTSSCSNFTLKLLKAPSYSLIPPALI